MKEVKELTKMTGMPVYINDGSDFIPPTESYFLLAKNGFYKVFKNAEIETQIKLEKLPGMLQEENSNSVVKWIGPKLPISTFWFVRDLFIKIYEKHKAEFDVQLYWSDKEQKFYVRVPHQRISGASVDWELRDDDAWYCNEEYVQDNSTLPDDVRHFGRIHSHNVMGAFWSGTDENDQKTQEYGIQIVMGKITTALEYKCRIVYNGNLQDVEFSDVVDTPAPANFELPEGIIITTPATPASTTAYMPPSTDYSTKGRKKKTRAYGYGYNTYPYGGYGDYGEDYDPYNNDPFDNGDEEEDDEDTATSTIPPKTFPKNVTAVEKFLYDPSVDLLKDEEIGPAFLSSIKDFKMIYDQPGSVLAKDTDFKWLLTGISKDVTGATTATDYRVLFAVAMFIAYYRDDVDDDQLSAPTLKLFKEAYNQFSSGSLSYRPLDTAKNVRDYVDTKAVFNTINKLPVLRSHLLSSLERKHSVQGVRLFRKALQSNTPGYFDVLKVEPFLDTLEVIAEVSRIPVFLFCGNCDEDFAGHIADILADKK